MKSLIHGRTLSATLTLVIAMLAMPSAFAADGTVTGRLQHWNRQGNFCPTSRNCTGAKYPQSQFNVARPIRHVKVYVRNESATILGQGSTDSLGNFSISWFSPSHPGRIHITWHAEHKDNRFFVRSASGGSWYFWTGRRTAVDGGTTAFGSMTWGSAGAPHDITNIYDGAHRTWWDSLYWSSRQWSRFTGVRIYAGSTRCPTSCADSDEVWLDPAAAYTPQARIMHEMGHTASQKAHEGDGYWVMTDYCFPGTGGGCGWNFTSPEWRQIATEEALATFIGDVSLYSSNAVQPHSCLSAASSACGTNAFNLETSSGTSCATNEDR